MTATDCYALLAKAAPKLCKEGCDKLSPIVSSEEPATRFELLDTFDSQIAASGRLLFRRGDTFELMTEEAGPLRQAATPDASPFVPGLADGPVKLALADVSPLRALLPVGSGEMQEAAMIFVDDDRKTRVRARILHLRSDGGGSLEMALLQSLRGYEKALDQVRGQIETLGGERIASKAVYSTLFPDRPVYTPKPGISLSPDEAAFDAANSIIAAHLPVAVANERGIVADHDIEFLHDYRVALRKVRSVISLFDGIYGSKTTDELKLRLAALMQQTGELRDLDVYLAEKHTFFEMVPTSMHPGLERLFERFEAQRAETQARLAESLESKAYRREMDRLIDLFSHRKKLRRGPNAKRPALEFAKALIWRRYRKVCKIAAEIDDQTPDDHVHRLRIQCKKLRYLIEFFAPVFSRKKISRITKALKRLQDNLGLFNDYSVQQDKLSALLDEMEETPGKRDLDIAQSIGALIVVLHKKQLEERARVVTSFAAFNDKPTRAAFRTLFHSAKATA